MEKKDIAFEIDIGLDITGVTTCITSEEKNSRSILIKREGSAVGNFIPSVIVICEDNLAKIIIEMITKETKGAYKIITVGAWDNMPTLLYGIYVYREQLQASGDRRFLEVVCITDGDIRNNDLKNVFDKLHRGVNVPEDMKKALALAREGLHGFCLDNSVKVGGLPEYHHQLWLNEVSQEIVITFHQQRNTELESALENADESNHKYIELELVQLKLEIAEVNRIANASREIKHYDLTNKRKRGKGNGIDCHKFYDTLKDQLSKGDTLTIYPLYCLEHSVLSIIRKYNPDRWRTYIAPVKDAMNKAFDHHFEMFNSDRFNLIELGNKK